MFPSFFIENNLFPEIHVSKKEKLFQEKIAKYSS
jgi:hypothetical protein